jgi:hypothetical protein
VRARYEFDVSLDDPAVVLLVQTFNGLQRVSFPPLGASTIFGPPSAPLGLIPAR